jgi:REP element-mobilizing transposase RayT
MANTYAKLHCHIVFSTKGRIPWIKPDLEQRVWEYLGGIARANRVVAHQIGGVDHHIHIAASVPPTMAISKVLQLLKGGSSHWANETIPRLKGFAWQDGYGAFSVSDSNLPAVIEYITKQRTHHHTQTFQEEFRAILAKHGIEADERFLWG